MRNLFDPIPLAHANDPLPSHLAAGFLVKSGKLAKHEAVVLTILLSNPGKTACELWQAASPAQQRELHELQRVRQRLTSLLNKGKVRQSGQRHCTVRGSLQTTWEAT